MDSVSAFVASPSEEAFDCLTKDQLRKIADHYQLEVDLPKTLRKQELRGAVKSKLLELGVISVDPLKVVPPRGPLLPQGAAPVSLPAACLTFEQQKQLLELQMERDRLAAGEREKDRQLEYDKLRRDSDRFKLLSEGRIAGVGDSDVLPPGRGSNEFSLSTMIKFLPKFNDRDPDTFFSLFENIADDRGWVDSERILLLQSVLTGRAQDAFVALSVAERRKYTSVKEAILKAYELVPEAYRQKFRNWRKGDRQTHTELVHLIIGEVVMAVRPQLPVEGVDVILGNNLAGGRVWANLSPPPVVNTVPLQVVSECAEQYPDVFCACAVTRAMTRVRDVSNTVPSLPVLPSTLSRCDLIAAQQGDDELVSILNDALSVDDMKSTSSGYFILDGVLVRKWTAFSNESVLQIVVPAKYRALVLQTAHGDVAGHFGVRKTYQRLMQHFYWPRLKRSVADFVRTCHVCQLTGKPNQSIKPAPLHPIPAVGQPFEHLIVDCVGPLPPSKSGCAYLLTVMCQSTRYPAAYPLRTITTRSVVKALSQFISIFGIPKIVQSDRGSNFTSGLFNEVLKQLRVTHQVSSAYHAQSQGALERFHSTLKSLLRAYCVELNRDWEEGLPWLLLAARDVTQESTGFSPNDLVFAHKVRGPLSVLKDGVEKVQPPVNLIDYVHGFRRKLLLAWKLASENLSKAQKKMKRLYDRRAEERTFHPGDQVLALLPVPGSPFCAKFSGPYVIVRQVTDVDYLLSTPDRKRSTQLCHINLLKPYYAPPPDEGAKSVGLAAVSRVIGDVQEVAAPDVVSPGDPVLQPRLKNSVMLANLDSLLCHLSTEQHDQLKRLILEFDALFSDVPRCTDVIQHDIVVDDVPPIRQRFYRVAPEKEKFLEAEVRYLLENGLAKPSYSSWASPCLLVAKPDNTFRFCTDYRKVNRVTKPDSFPLPRMEDCVDRVGSAQFVSKFDLLKGYYQVPLTPRAQEISAFITPSGLYSYNVMSFGLRNAPSTFQRLMNRVIAGLEGCAVYLDDAVTYSNTWEEHLSHVRALFQRLLAAKLTVNLAKCEFARATVVYLGKVVGQGQVCPVRAKVQAIDKFPPPTTKKELMRFLGMVGYYRSFCANFSSVVSPLTSLLKKDARFEWTDVCQSAFENAKLLLSTAPVLAAPRLDMPFQIQVDASQVGAGAVLLQSDDNGVDRPVCYFSRKFNKHQLNYSVIEKEALALVWALQHFDVYVGGGVRPVVVYSDHNPLTFLHSLQNPNQRLMRWALFLQPYQLDIRHIRGVENIMADALSRCPSDE
ncbi:hypothetical protein ACEWY4_027927 [Coilia grayii]|uniref:Gypsy retrotransposon integrase-like protein 1 n=1 Tax=Coilia grayii TaxID=363190 RepID=A0ABD1IN83_9TELE